MRFAILGALEAYDDDGQRLQVRGRQQRAVLAVLLLEANRVVSTDRLVDCLWGVRPPERARSLLQGCVADLRRALRVGRRQPLATQPPGYRLQVGIQRATGYRLGIADTLVTLGQAISRSDPAAAQARWDEAGEIFRNIGAPDRNPRTTTTVP